MQQEIKKGKNVYRDAYLVANAYYNMSYYGNARLFYESDNVTFSNIYFIDPDSLDAKYMSTRFAAKYYQLARANALNNEQRARCTFMLSKCALNDVYNHTGNAYDKKYYAYFDELKAKYSKTSYYKEVLAECGFYKEYLAGKRDFFLEIKSD
jgi:hypothetical protein